MYIGRTNIYIRSVSIFVLTHRYGGNEAAAESDVGANDPSLL